MSAQNVNETNDNGSFDIAEGAYLPSDRLAERRLDLARKLIVEKRWSDVVTLLDEILSSDSDSFFRSDGETSTWRSVKSEACALVRNLPGAGRDAYQLQFQSKAERQLNEFLAKSDERGVAMVARRWLSTPAGEHATLLSAMHALDHGKPLAAAAWLDRLATVAKDKYEPTLSVMRAVAWQHAGHAKEAADILDRVRTSKKTTLRLGGRDASVSFPGGRGEQWLSTMVGDPPEKVIRSSKEWLVYRGGPSRNVIVKASRPLLVPRYRVPLTRHPEESKWLDEKRQKALDSGQLLLPASTPLAVDGTILLHTPMGLLSVDFETGKRLWLQSGGAAAPVSENLGDGDDPSSVAAARGRMLGPVFEDATSGTLASDGRLVFAVESHPDALMGYDFMELRQRNIFNGGISQRGWSGGNSLVAYDVRDRGSRRWRLPAPASDRPTNLLPWFLGAPLPVSDRLFILVEEMGEVRLDVLNSFTGDVLWSQPLVELEENLRVDHYENHARRVSGLSPALAEGVLVCPTGAGTVVAVDLATRTLLWAFNYRVTGSEDMVVTRNGIRVPRVGRIINNINGRMVVSAGSSREKSLRRWLDNSPVLANGCAFLAPGESDQLHCIDLRTGSVRWQRPRENGLYVAGVVGKSLFVVGSQGVEALNAESGEREWFAKLVEDGSVISGRGLVVADKMFIPLDTPEVVELDLNTGAILGRSQGRGGAVPGNLVAYRGEVISQSIDSLDVFHQTVPLESKIETAIDDASSEEEKAWALLWRGQLRLDRGAVDEGLSDMRTAASLLPGRFPPDMMPAALIHSIEQSPSTSKSIWKEFVDLRPPYPILKQGLRLVVDSLIQTKELPDAWQACRRLYEEETSQTTEVSLQLMVSDVRDPDLSIKEERWLRSRLDRIYEQGSARLQKEIDDFSKKTLASIQSESVSLVRLQKQLDFFIRVFGHHSAARQAREDRLQAIDLELQRVDPLKQLFVADKDFAMLEVIGRGSLNDREHAKEDFIKLRRSLDSVSGVQAESLWPQGQVLVNRGGAVGTRQEKVSTSVARSSSFRISAGRDALLSGLQVLFDVQRRSFIFRDRFGRSLGEPVVMPKQNHGLNWGITSLDLRASDVTIIGRVAFIQSGGFIAAYELSPPTLLGRGAVHRHLWTHEAPVFPVTMRRGMNQVFPRDMSVPLGMAIPEPNLEGFDSPRYAAATVTGVPLLVGRTLQLFDPLTGGIIWERRRLSGVSSMFGDDEYLCLCPSSGKQATVVSMATGHIVTQCDLPDREWRLFSAGRYVFAVVAGKMVFAGAGKRKTEEIHLVVIDPVTQQQKKLGTFSGDSRATKTDEHLFVLEPSGVLTVIDLDRREVAFSTNLPDMPARLERLVVLPWQNNFIVIAGRQKTANELRLLERVGTIRALSQENPINNQPLTGSIWSIDGRDGSMQWPAPATILHHCVCLGAWDVPVLLFARQIEVAAKRSNERPRLSLLCIDKRTGGLLFADDKILSQSNKLTGCRLVGDPINHSVSVVPTGSGNVPSPVSLLFREGEARPQLPYQAADHPIIVGDMATELDYWWKRFLAMPIPF
ncbi:MAG: PQQ-binding-like beta-propeller repeat protein [Pirellulales bacterium]